MVSFAIARSLEENWHISLSTQPGQTDRPLQQGFAINIKEAIIEVCHLKTEGSYNVFLPI
jgi:hypothetical protein